VLETRMAFIYFLNFFRELSILLQKKASSLEKRGSTSDNFTSIASTGISS